MLVMFMPLCLSFTLLAVEQSIRKVLSLIQPDDQFFSPLIFEMIQDNDIKKCKKYNLSAPWRLESAIQYIKNILSKILMWLLIIFFPFL